MPHRKTLACLYAKDCLSLLGISGMVSALWFLAWLLTLPQH